MYFQRYFDLKIFTCKNQFRDVFEEHVDMRLRIDNFDHWYLLY